MYNKVLKFIEENKMIEAPEGVILGVSGGADSVCLLKIFAKIREELGVSITAVHVNHNIRGKSAKEDEDFVKDLCNRLSVELVVKSLDVPAYKEKNGISMEEAGRQLRYRVFQEVLTEKGAGKIAVAHNKNDDVETVILNLCRGTGLKGLSGIPAVRGNIIRPLLCLSREEIENYLKSEGQEFRTDETNLETEYTRNKVRLNLLPFLTENINSNAGDNILRAAGFAKEAEDYLQKESQRVFKEFVREEKSKRPYGNSGDTDEVFQAEINEAVFKMDDIIVKRVIRMSIDKVAGRLKDITFEHVAQILELSEKNVGAKTDLPYCLEVQRTYQGITIRKKTSGSNLTDEKSQPEDLEISTEKIKELTYKKGEAQEYKFGESVFKIKVFDWKEDLRDIPNLMYTKCFDYDKINDNLHIRFRRTGDLIQIDAKGGNKKIKDYFIDEKIPKEERDYIPLLASENNILWVVGHRIGEQFRITKETKMVLEISYEHYNI